MRSGSIYALTTPEGTPFYVGATQQRVRERVMQHLRDARRGRKGSAVHELLAATERVGFWVIETEVGWLRLGERERFHKKRLEAAGFRMLNYHHGGNGCNFQSAKVKKRIAAFARTRPRTEGGQFMPISGVGAGPEGDPEEIF